MQTFVCICVVGAQPLKIHDSENTKDFIVVKINRVLKQGKLAIKAIICPSCTCMFCSLMFLLPYLVLSLFLFKHIHSLTSIRPSAVEIFKQHHVIVSFTCTLCMRSLPCLQMCCSVIQTVFLPMEFELLVGLIKMNI